MKDNKEDDENSTMDMESVLATTFKDQKKVSINIDRKNGRLILIRKRWKMIKETIKILP